MPCRFTAALYNRRIIFSACSARHTSEERTTRLRAVVAARKARCLRAALEFLAYSVVSNDMLSIMAFKSDCALLRCAV
jgi:hypothetical protein